MFEYPAWSRALALPPLSSRLGRSLSFAAAVAAAWAAHAQPIPYGELGGPDTPANPAPYATLQASGASLRGALQAARAGDGARAQAAAAALGDPVAAKLVSWALIDGGARLDFSTVEQARKDLAGWPREGRRLMAGERALDASSLSPQDVTTWFAGREPLTAEGALVLAAAFQAQGLQPEAEALVRHWWRDRVFEADVQARMLARFPSVLTADDHARRLSLLLWGPQGPATRAVLDLVGPDERALATARMALRAGRGDAQALADALPASVASDSGLAFDRARFLGKRELTTAAVAALRGARPPANEAAQATWTERRTLMRAALTAGDPQGAYLAASEHGMSPGGENYSEAEFFAGWIALTKLRDPARAEPHFANVQRAGLTPVTLSRALYWRGRAAEALGRADEAAELFRQGGTYTTAFYGQLAAGRAGLTQITLARDPEPTAAERAAFEAREPVRAARLLAGAGERDSFRGFVLAVAESLTAAVDFAQLHDLAKSAGDQDLAMRVARIAGQKNAPLAERGWPLVTVPTVAGGAELPLSLAIARQESNFDPRARSAFARGLMQLRPITGAQVARKLGIGFSADRLDEAQFNLTLGSSYLGQMVDTFGGSYVMAAAAYNAGPGRPARWASDCGDPRGGASDASDFIECIPFSETRNYVMRVMENYQVYRARLAGGAAPLTLAADLKRGSWTPGATLVAGASPGPTGGPIPYSDLSGPH